MAISARHSEARSLNLFLTTNFFLIEHQSQSKYYGTIVSLEKKQPLPCP